LISVQNAAASLKLLRGSGKESIHCGGVGLAERRQEFWQRSRASPLIVGEHFHALDGPANFGTFGPRPYDKLSLLSFGQSGEIGMVRLQV
jgi:hypothetical protein